MFLNWPGKNQALPRQSQAFVENLQQVMLEKTGKAVEAMVYGDGAFKDPVGKIWGIGWSCCLTWLYEEVSREHLMKSN